MRVSFVRTAGKPDRVYVQRTAGGESSWTFPSYGDALPHDLVHLVVESAFDVRRGLWARVDEGLDLARVNAAANRIAGPLRAKYAALGADLDDVLVSEALAAGRYGDSLLNDADCVAQIATQCAATSVARPPTLLASRIPAVRATLARLTSRWRACVPKGALDLHFDARHLAETFASL